MPPHPGISCGDRQISNLVERESRPWLFVSSIDFIPPTFVFAAFGGGAKGNIELIIPDLDRLLAAWLLRLLLSRQIAVTWRAYQRQN